MSIVNPNKHWEVQSYGMIINKGEIMVNREKLETIVYVFEGKFYVEDLAETKQTEIYSYCKMNVVYPACRANLKQIRIAVTRIYFRNLGLNY